MKKMENLQFQNINEENKWISWIYRYLAIAFSILAIDDMFRQHALGVEVNGQLLCCLKGQEK